MTSAPTWTIAQIADEFGVTHRTVRHYEDLGLISPERRGTARVYRRRDRTRLGLILRGKRLGFTLASIRQYLDLYDAEPTHETQLRHLLAGTRRRIDELERQRQALELALRELRDIERQTLDAIDIGARKRRSR